MKHHILPEDRGPKSPAPRVAPLRLRTMDTGDLRDLIGTAYRRWSKSTSWTAVAMDLRSTARTILPALIYPLRHCSDSDGSQRVPQIFYKHVNQPLHGGCGLLRTSHDTTELDALAIQSKNTLARYFSDEGRRLWFPPLHGLDWLFVMTRSLWIGQACRLHFDFSNASLRVSRPSGATMVRRQKLPS